MPRKQFAAEQIITKLREAEVLLSQGMTVIEAARKLEISEQTYYRWRKEYGGLDTTQANANAVRADSPTTKSTNNIILLRPFFIGVPLPNFSIGPIFLDACYANLLVHHHRCSTPCKSSNGLAEPVW